MGTKSTKMKCFIITPIGDEKDPIRRHIEGVIEAAITPALGEKYEIVVAHKIYEPGSITKQIISEIYNSELVIANITNRNPNVMYELALRHAIGKPVITIAEKGTSLPADIVTERTIFYYNDAKGVLELIEDLKKAEAEIDLSKTSGPIVDVLGDISRDTQIIQRTSTNNPDEIEPLKFILQRLDRIETTIKNTNAHPHSTRFSNVSPYKKSFFFKYENITHQTSMKTLNTRLSFLKSMANYIEVLDINIDKTEKIIAVTLLVSDDIDLPEVYQYCYKTFSECGFKNVSVL